MERASMGGPDDETAVAAGLEAGDEVVRYVGGVGRQVGASLR